MFTTNGYHVEDVARTAYEAFRHASGAPEWEEANRRQWVDAAIVALGFLDIPHRDPVTRKVSFADVAQAMRKKAPESIGWEAAARHIFNLVRSTKPQFERQRESLERLWSEWAQGRMASCQQQ